MDDDSQNSQQVQDMSFNAAKNRKTILLSQSLLTQLASCLQSDVSHLFSRLIGCIINLIFFSSLSPFKV